MLSVSQRYLKLILFFMLLSETYSFSFQVQFLWPRQADASFFGWWFSLNWAIFRNIKPLLVFCYWDFYIPGDDDPTRQEPHEPGQDGSSFFPMSYIYVLEVPTHLLFWPTRRCRLIVSTSLISWMFHKVAFSDPFSVLGGSHPSYRGVIFTK